MLKYDRIDISEGIDADKTNESRECKFCHYWYFLNKNFKYGPYLCHIFMIYHKNQQILKILLLFILKNCMQNFFLTYQQT